MLSVLDTAWNWAVWSTLLSERFFIIIAMYYCDLICLHLSKLNFFSLNIKIHPAFLAMSSCQGSEGGGFGAAALLL